jgi:hypothetical protein
MTKADTTMNPNYNFFRTELINGRWSQPWEMGYSSLIYNYNSQPCITKNGTIYFTSDLPDWIKTMSYMMESTDNNYSAPVLFEPVNKWRNNENWTVYEFCVSPDEDYIIVCIEDKADSNSSADLYISYLQDDDWTLPRRLERGINSDETENFPTVTNDGKYLIFTRAFSEYKIIATKLFTYKR